MTKTIKILLTGFLIVLGGFIIFTLLINRSINNKISNFLDNRLPSNITQSHSNMNIDSFAGTVTLSDVLVKLANKSDTITHTIVKLDQLIIEDVSYWDYLVNDVIRIEDIKLKSPNITYYKDKVTLNKEISRQAPITLYKPIIIDELSIDNSTLKIIEKDKDSILLYAANATIELDDLKISKETLLKKIPVDYNKYEVQADSVFVKISPYENLTVGAIKIKDKNALFNNLHLKTKYSRKTLSKMIANERDHVALLIEKIDINDIDFGFNNKDKFFVKSPLITIKKPVATMFRDKLVTDDLKTKKLYSKLLRETKIDLTIDKVDINNGALTYTERVKEDNSGGTIDFKNLYASINNASNTYASPLKTVINIDAQFMQHTPLKANWTFDINDTNDQFLFKAELGKMVASDLNTFMKPNLKVQLEGVTNKTYLTISGTNTASQIDMKLSYNNFKVNILNKRGNKKNRFLSAIANVFIKKNSDTEPGGFREGTGTATRDRSKSFFNYLWLNIRAALLDTLTGDGSISD